MKNFIKILTKRSKRLKKHYFQLLELMVAVLLLLLCVTPSMRIYTNMYVAQQSIIRENQRDHLAYRIHAFITEQLYKRLIPFSELMKSQETPIQDPVLQDELKKWGYEASYLFFDLKKKKSNNKSEKADKRIVTLLISIKDTLNKTAESNFQSHSKNLSKNFLEEQANNPAITQYTFKIYLFTPEGESAKENDSDEEEALTEEADLDDDDDDDENDNEEDEDEDEKEEEEKKNPLKNSQNKKNQKTLPKTPPKKS